MEQVDRETKNKTDSTKTKINNRMTQEAQQTEVKTDLINTLKTED